MALIFIECGTSLRSPFATGIQRVVRNIVREAANVSKSLGHECVNVRFNGREFELVEINDKQWQLNERSRLFAFGTKCYRTIKRLLPLSIHKGILRLVTLFQGLYFRAKKQPNYTMDLALASYKSRHTDKEFAERPILLLLDSTWDMRIWKHIDTFKSKGGHVSAVLYDLIPFTHPETVEKHTGAAHTTWWLKAPQHLDSVMCISKTVRNQFVLWQQDHYLKRRVPACNVDYFYLGSDLGVKAVAAGIEPFSTVGYGSYFLVVGSIEPRKNHNTILDAFELLWQDEVAISLVIVGSHGWMSEGFLERVTNHPLRDKRLFLLRSTSDAELAHLYADALALLIASVAEGFGLPIVEAFKHGTRVICSDIEVFREVAGESAVYFAPYNHIDLAAKLFKTYSTPTVLQKRDLPPTIAWLTWQDSAASLLNKLSQFQRKTKN